MKPRPVPLRPAHPERTCWGCDTYCPADDLACGNGKDRAQHPIELFGEDWLEWFSREARQAISIRDSLPVASAADRPTPPALFL